MLVLKYLKRKNHIFFLCNYNYFVIWSTGLYNLQYLIMNSFLIYKKVFCARAIFLYFLFIIINTYLKKNLLSYCHDFRSSFNFKTPFFFITSKFYCYEFYKTLIHFSLNLLFFHLCLFTSFASLYFIFSFPLMKLL